MTDKDKTVGREDPSVLGAGCGVAPMPTAREAEAVWRQAYVDRMVERGVALEDARACCEAVDADLSESPSDAADAELEYWGSDE
jgi:hypothetical protein